VVRAGVKVLVVLVLTHMSPHLQEYMDVLVISKRQKLVQSLRQMKYQVQHRRVAVVGVVNAVVEVVNAVVVATVRHKRVASVPFLVV
jgi:hypothetical protein